MSSDEESETIKQNGKHYTIDLQAFSGSKIRLETELRNSYSSIEILDTYCADGIKYNDVNPFLNPGGANPLLMELYRHAEDGDIKTPWGNCEMSDIGRTIHDDMTSEDNIEYATKCVYGDMTEATPFPSPQAIHHWPAKTWRNVNAYFVKRGNEIYTSAQWKKLTKTMRNWLARVHKIWSKIVGRLPSNGMHLTGGLEMSNGVSLYNRLLQRYGNTHAQCLGEILRLLTNIALLKPDPKTKKLETIRDYFDRAIRMAREAKEFHAMKFPIAGPLLKVMILEGLRRSNEEKYGTQITQAYVDDLKSDLEHLQGAMETVEGLRAEKIRDEYAPTLLSTGEINATEGSGKGNPSDPRNHPNKPCKLPGHVGHLNKECRSQWGRRATKYRGRGTQRKANQNQSSPKNNNCFHFVAGRTCPFGDRCRYEHNIGDARAYHAQNTYLPAEETTENAATVSSLRSIKNPYGYIVNEDQVPPGND